jgi:type II restriction/modification system DNA methylase subunit YeeA
LGDEYVEALFTVYKDRVPAEADFVCYWFAKAWEAMQARRASRTGLVATNSIRGGANRRVLDPIAAEKRNFRGLERRALDHRGRRRARVASVFRK